MNKEQECYPFYLHGYECETEEEAWATFTDEAEQGFKWIKGYKIWRVPPSCSFVKRYPEDEGCFIVRARAVALDVLPEGVEEARIERPYPEKTEPFKGVTAFGF